MMGDTGLMGFRGESGLMGYKGWKGKPGHRGDRGETGDKGKDGGKGSKGEPGIGGRYGHPGHDGEKGCRGQRGATGYPGLIFYGKKKHSSYKRLDTTKSKSAVAAAARDSLKRIEERRQWLPKLLPSYEKEMKLVGEKQMRQPSNRQLFDILGQMTIHTLKVKLKQMSNLASNTPSDSVLDPHDFTAYDNDMLMHPKFPYYSLDKKYLPAYPISRKVKLQKEVASVDVEWIFTGLNKLWRESRKPLPCIHCSLFDFLDDQNTQDLDAYIM
ncbi:hypothetical protein HAZT_HAZT011667 [Hyalella azteca]|uniref:Uncharacterized protein n=1 Tax=Hyalella azteca TaxID=294128 RepID=A0A6A0GS02_HYAAZ|nr:hypothetical protein HAZT_HAZT011667 [Hyalella azteca]